MRKYTIINALSEATHAQGHGLASHATVHIENIIGIESVIEKLNSLPTDVLMIDEAVSIEDSLKITKIAQLLHPEIEVQVFDHRIDETYNSTVLRLWRNGFVKRMSAHSYEDNPNLNNPFLNMKENIFN